MFILWIAVSLLVMAPAGGRPPVSNPQLAGVVNKLISR